MKATWDASWILHIPIFTIWKVILMLRWEINICLARHSLYRWNNDGYIVDDYEGKKNDDDDDDEVVHGRLTCRLSLPLLIGNGLLKLHFCLCTFAVFSTLATVQKYHWVLQQCIVYFVLVPNCPQTWSHFLVLHFPPLHSTAECIALVRLWLYLWPLLHY